MATYNEIHPNMGSNENHNALYMVVGIILALMIAGFAFYYYNDGGSADTTTDSAGTVVERVIEPSSGSTNGSAETENDVTETNSMTLDTDSGTVSTSTTRSGSNY